MKPVKNGSKPDFAFAPRDFFDELDHLQNEGFDAGELAYFQAFGLTDDQIVDVRRNEIAQLEQGGFTSTTIYELLHAYHDFFREAADDLFLRHPPRAMAATGQLAAAATADGAFWTTGPMRTTFTVGNPANTQKTVELMVRPVDVPLNWTYSLDNPAPSLAAGETTTVTLTIDPGDDILEGTMVRLAVEGFIDSDYVGGILFERGAQRVKNQWTANNLTVDICQRQPGPVVRLAFGFRVTFVECLIKYGRVLSLSPRYGGPLKRNDAALGAPFQRCYLV